MTKFRKIIVSRSIRDGITGGLIEIFNRALQPLKKDGSDSKRKPFVTSKQVHIYPDGSTRFYGSNGVLKYERKITNRAELEINAVEMD